MPFISKHCISVVWTNSIITSYFWPFSFLSKILLWLWQSCASSHSTDYQLWPCSLCSWGFSSAINRQESLIPCSQHSSKCRERTKKKKKKPNACLMVLCDLSNQSRREKGTMTWGEGKCFVPHSQAVKCCTQSTSVSPF